MEEEISNIINKSLKINKDNLYNNTKEIIKFIKIALERNKEAIFQTNKIDQKNNNGFIMDFNIILNIFNNIQNEEVINGTITHLEKDEEKRVIYGKQIMPIGNVILINDGNSYVIIEMILRCILAGNTIIIVNDGYMYGTNEFIVRIVKDVLEKFNISEYLISIYRTNNYEEVLNNYANIDLVVCIGNNNLQRNILEKCKSKIIVSGYENFDLYIEDTTNINFLDKIMDMGLNIQVYAKDDLNLKYDNILYTSSIEEAVAQINYNGSNYCASIFTSNQSNATYFIKMINAKMVTINTSPLIERIIDIKQEDLVQEKIVIYPINFNLTNDKLNIKIDEVNNDNI